MHILIVEGNTPEKVAVGVAGSTSFETTLRALHPDIGLSTKNPYSAELRPTDFDNVDGVVFTGSGEAWATDAPEAAPQRAAIELAFESGLPVWGSCNGLNLATVVLGGAVAENPNGIEIGLAKDLRLTEAGQTHPMMQGRSRVYAVPCVHRDHVSRLPEIAVLIAENDHTKVQAFAINSGGIDFWGTQYHPEASPSDIAVYVRNRGIFAHLHAMADDLDAAETDSDAAMRLGTRPEALSFGTRSKELSNWLEHVGARAERD
jgi:GMP synthase (glutamine-hydrolysing)